MKVKIEFELDVDCDSIPRSWINNLVDDLTDDIRSSKFLKPGTWKIEEFLEPYSTSDESLCVCGKLINMHFDSREISLPKGAVISHPPKPKD